VRRPFFFFPRLTPNSPADARGPRGVRACRFYTPPPRSVHSQHKVPQVVHRIRSSSNVIATCRPRAAALATASSTGYSVSRRFDPVRPFAGAAIRLGAHPYNPKRRARHASAAESCTLCTCSVDSDAPAVGRDTPHSFLPAACTPSAHLKLNAKGAILNAQFVSFVSFMGFMSFVLTTNGHFDGLCSAI
jgi:hypothetical protein